MVKFNSNNKNSVGDPVNYPALLLIDVQKGFDEPSWGKRNNLDAEQKIFELLSAWRKKSWPVIHVQHCSTEAGSSLAPDHLGCEFKDETKPIGGEEQFKKNVNSAFIGTGLEDHLREQDIKQLVIVGLTTDHCVSTSTRMAGNLGFDVTLVSDATATFDKEGIDGKLYSADEIHAIHLASLNDEFCKVKSTADVLSEIAI
jgi:nicotinamidase-related amidase